MTIAPSEVWRAILPPGVVAYETRRFIHAPSLYPEERSVVRNAVAKRVEEFAAGRACARRALQDLGFQPGPLPRDADRRPVWPSGVVGSITHTDDYCGAAVARREVFVGIGIDTETVGRVEDGVLRLICTPTEQVWLAAIDGPQRAEAATILFSAKEAFFKAQSGLEPFPTRSNRPGRIKRALSHMIRAFSGGEPVSTSPENALGGDFNDFQDVTLHLRDGVFCVEPLRPFGPTTAIRGPLEGRYAVRAGAVFTGIAFLAA